MRKVIISVGLIVIAISVIASLSYLHSQRVKTTETSMLQNSKNSSNSNTVDSNLNTNSVLQNTTNESIVLTEDYVYTEDYVQNDLILTQEKMDLGKNKALVSFRIDDVTFRTKEYNYLQNALTVGKKYNITFDLGVIAEPFDKEMDPNVFKLYEDNKEVFEIVAHGYTHANPLLNTSKGEFYDHIRNISVPYEIQEEHIKRMIEIFEKRNLYWGTKIFFLPWHAGDNTTIKIAEKYGYLLMTQDNLPIKGYEYTDGKIIVSKIRVIVAIKDNLNESEIINYREYLEKHVLGGRTNIEVVTHPANYYNLDNIDRLVHGLVENSSTNIQFGFVSERFKK